MKYEMGRASEALERRTQRDLATGTVYVYTKYPDRWDVHKFVMAEVAESPLSGDELLSVTTPSYRVAAGECSCPGFEFRGRCRHSMFTGEAAG